jgi:beta-lactam-binding protein with PASTA domain
MKVKVKIPVTERNRTVVDKVLHVLSITKMVILRTFGGIAMFAVFILFAFLAMRVAIHGREVTVPNLANLSDADAASTLKKLGLNLSVDNRFYAATVPVNHVLSQSPIPGARVRSGWQIRVTESLGTQQVPVPDVTGQSEGPATLMLRRLQLEVGTVAHIPAPAPAGIILAQSPPPNESGLDGPRVALLVADDEEAPGSIAYVMPSIDGLTVATANERLRTAGLHIAAAPAPVSVPDTGNPTDTPAQPESSSPAATPPTDAAIPATIEAEASPPILGSSVITSQSPLPGHRVSRADAIHITVANNETTPN